MRAIHGVMVVAFGAVALAAAAGATDTVAASATSNTDNDVIICKKTLETGSLVKRTKQCFTKAQWDRLAEAHQRGVQKTVGGLSEASISN